MTWFQSMCNLEFESFAHIDSLTQCDSSPVHLPAAVVGQQFRLLVYLRVRVDLVDVAFVEQILGVAPQLAPKTLLATHLGEAKMRG